MKIIFIFLIIFSNFAISLERENSFTFGIDYNSLLYEFEEKKENSFYLNFDLKGTLFLKKNFLYYNFSFLYPFSSSEVERKPLKIGTGNLNYKNSINLWDNKNYEFSFFYNFRRVENSPLKVPVEEETFDFYGMDNSFNLFSNFKFKLGLSFLKPENYKIFENEKYYLGLKYSKELRENLKIFSDLNFSKYDFEKKILTIPEEQDGLPIPVLKEHNENLYSFDLGFEKVSFYIINIMVFFQKRNATIEDFSNKSFGLEGIFSMEILKDLNMSIAFRYEKRELSKKFLFFEPNILTNIGTSYIYLNFKKILMGKNSLNLILGRFVHDAREDFFKTKVARYKIGIQYNLNF